MKKVLISGCFNILHIGHQRLFQAAKDIGDYLIVAVQSDRIAGNAAKIPDKLRLESVLSNNLVDLAFIFDSNIQEVIYEHRPHYVLKGKEHESAFNIELEALSKVGGQLLFNSGEAFFPYLDDLRESNNNSLFYNSIKHQIALEYLKRHQIDLKRINEIIERFKTLKVCIVGDIIVDEYISCQPLGMSREEVSIVVTPLEKKRFIGGAGIVSLHVASLGAQVKLITLGGRDELANFVTQELIESNIDLEFHAELGRQTTLKQRFRSDGRSLLRVNHLSQFSASKAVQVKIIDSIRKNIHSFDLLIFSDFNYGCLPQEMVEEIISLCNNSNVLIVADSQSSSQIGDVSRFHDVAMLTPTEYEARLATQSNDDGLVILAEKLQKKSKVKNIILKIGKEGLIIHSSDFSNENNFKTDKIPALNSVAKDTAGAGDSLLAASALALASGATIWESAYLGAVSAAIQVEYVGAKKITSELIYNYLSMQ